MNGCISAIQSLFQRSWKKMTPDLATSIEKISLSEVIYGCNVCEKQFTFFALTGEQGNYGSFILYAKNGDMAFWHALADPVFDEASKIAKTSSLLTGAGEYYKSGKYLAICGVCCDCAPDGSIYRLEPSCPHCMSKNIKFLRAPETVWKFFDLPVVTHDAWNKLTRNAKRQLIDDALSKVID